MADTDEVASLRILASAIAGRAVDVALADPGRRTWSDGSTIFLEPAVKRAERVRLLGVQASLIAAGSLDREMLDALGRGKGLARRYLAIEGHRALAVNEPALPPDVARLIESGRVEGLQSAHDSLVLARERRSIEPDWVLGDIHPRQVRSTRSSRPPPPSPNAMVLESAIPSRSRPPDLDTLDDDDGFDLGNIMTSPVGGGGPLGRLLAKLFTPSRRQGGGGSPGADTPTHYAGARPGSGAVFMSTTPLTEMSTTDPADADSAHLPRMGRTSERLPARLVFGPRARRGRGLLEHGGHARHTRHASGVGSPRPGTRAEQAAEARRRHRHRRGRRSTGRSASQVLRTTMTSTSRTAVSGEISPSSSCSTYRGRPASRRAAVGPCTSNRSRQQARSWARSTSSAIEWRSTPSTREAEVQSR